MSASGYQGIIKEMNLVDILQAQLSGEVLTSDDVLQAFSTDASLYWRKPQMVVYPRHERDVRRLLRWSTSLIPKGHYLPLTPRGAGSDLMGAAIGSGIILACEPHLNNLLEYDNRKGIFVVEPGLKIAALNQILRTQYRFFPPTPASANFATIGGAVANNAGGYYSEKYGLTLDYIKSLRLVLANGDVIVAQPLSRRQTAEKLALDNFEGSLYRGLKDLLVDRRFALASWRAGVSPSYNLQDVYNDGRFNLLPLLVGSQGTLGVVTSIELVAKNYNPQPVAAIIRCPNMPVAVDIVRQIKDLKPAAIEMIDGYTLQRIKRLAPSIIAKNQLSKVNILLLVEFDDLRSTKARRALRKTTKICRQHEADWRLIKTNADRHDLGKIREATSYVILDSTSKGRHLPGLEDAKLPLDNIPSFYQEAQALFKRSKISFMSWGHLGLGQISLMPKINWSQPASRRLYQQIMKDYLKLVFEHEGSSSFAHNAGRGRGVFLPQELGADLYQLNLAIKQLFDPNNLLNPGVRFVDEPEAEVWRSNYRPSFCNYLPHF